MSTQVEALVVEALKLTAAERAQLVDRLLASLSPTDIEEAWASEVERRIAEIESGHARTVPAAAAIARARDALL